MDAKEKTLFSVDASKCIRCGRCVAVCTGMVIEQDESGLPHMLPFERFGWRGCWRCEHCLAVCPVGAISIFGKTPEMSLPPAPAETGEYLERLVANRRSCRRYRDEDVNPAIIDRILTAMQNVPAGGNARTGEGPETAGTCRTSLALADACQARGQASGRKWGKGRLWQTRIWESTRRNSDLFL